MNKLKLLAFLLVLSASLGGCYTKFTASEADGRRPDDDQYSESYSYYAPTDSLFSGQTTIINNYYGPYSRFFTPSWGWYYDPYWYDPYWYDPYWRPSAFYWGAGFYYGGWYPWYHHHYYPWHPHYYSGGGSSGNQMPRTSGRLRSSYRSSKLPLTTPEVRPATIPWNTSTRPVRTAPQTTGGNKSQEAVRKSGSGEKQTKSGQRPSVRTRSVQKPATRQTDKANENKDSQRTNNRDNDSNYRSPNRREEPRSYSPPSQNSEPRGGGNGGQSGGNRGSGNTSTRQR